MRTKKDNRELNLNFYKAEVRRIRAELSHVNIQLSAWYQAFGTTQLSHAVAKRDRLMLFIPIKSSGDQ